MSKRARRERSDKGRHCRALQKNSDGVYDSNEQEERPKKELVQSAYGEVDLLKDCNHPKHPCLSKTNKVVVKPFASATTEGMEDFIKPILRKDPENIIIHVGTNDVNSK